MDNLFNTILVNLSSDLTVMQSIVTMLVAIALGVMIAFTYYKTQDEEYYQRSLAITLCILPVILSVIILFIGSNIARAFSLAGTLSIIRFRSNPGDAKDIGYIFFDIAAGLSCGVGLYAYGALFTALLCGIIFIIEKTKMFRVKDIKKTLKIVIPEDLNYQSVFDETLKKYTKKYSLKKIKTTDLGSLFELVYDVTMSADEDEQQFLNDLRCKNGNLTITLSLAPQN